MLLSPSLYWKETLTQVFSCELRSTRGCLYRLIQPLLEKCPNMEFFLVRISRIWTEYGEILCQSLFLIKLQVPTYITLTENLRKTTSQGVIHKFTSSFKAAFGGYLGNPLPSFPIAASAKLYNISPVSVFTHCPPFFAQ